MRGAVVGVALGVLAIGCSAGGDPKAFLHRALYDKVAQCAASFLEVDGDWKEDFGDAAAYGPAFYARAGRSEQNAGYQNLARKAFDRNLQVIQSDLLTGDLNEMIMAALGIIETIDATGDRGDLPALDKMIGDLNAFVAGVGYYVAPELAPGYAMTTYGPASVNGLLALLSLQRAQVLGGTGAEDPAPFVAWAKQVAAQIEARHWSAASSSYSFGSGREALFLYPNITMIACNVRLYQLTQEEAFLTRARDIYEGIQPLKVTAESGWSAPGRYLSPYSAEHMGAKTKNYTTLSSQNYLMFALMLLYQATGEDRFLLEVNPVLDFIDSLLLGQSCLKDIPKTDTCKDACTQDLVCLEQNCYPDQCHCAVLHHWMDERVALPADPEYFCSGCNHQLLYLLWYRQNKIQ